MRTIIDTNVWVCLAIEDTLKLTDKEESILKKFKTINQPDLVVPEFVIGEFSVIMQKSIPLQYNIINTTQHRKLVSVSLELIKTIEENTFVYTTDFEDRNKGFEIYNSSLIKNFKERELTYFDFQIISIALNKNYEILSLDKQLLKLHKKLMREPK